jgi:hypothetical protein
MDKTTILGRFFPGITVYLWLINSSLPLLVWENFAHFFPGKLTGLMMKHSGKDG